MGVIFSRAKIIKNNEVLKCSFPKTLQFYKNFLQEKEEIWKSIFYKIFGINYSIEIIFEEINEKKISDSNIKVEIKEEKVDTERVFDFKFLNKNKLNERKVFNNNEKSLIAKEIEKFFPGKLNIAENKNEKKHYT